jgi:hypothetical protein
MACALECRHCKARVDAKELFSYEADDSSKLPFAAKFTFAKCPACNSQFLAGQIEDLHRGEGWFDPFHLCPPTEKAFYPSVPENVARAFLEARDCHRIKAFTAAAIMCRKTLEGICSAHGTKPSGTLAAQLKKLKDDGVIESSPLVESARGRV